MHGGDHAGKGGGDDTFGQVCLCQRQPGGGFFNRCSLHGNFGFRGPGLEHAQIFLCRFQLGFSHLQSFASLVDALLRSEIIRKQFFLACMLLTGFVQRCLPAPDIGLGLSHFLGARAGLQVGEFCAGDRQGGFRLARFRAMHFAVDLDQRFITGAYVSGETGRDALTATGFGLPITVNANMFFC